MAEAASLVSFRVAMTCFEPVLCHAANRISNKKDQEKIVVHPETFQRALWSSIVARGDDV